MLSVKENVSTVSIKEGKSIDLFSTLDARYGEVAFLAHSDLLGTVLKNDGT